MGDALGKALWAGLLVICFMALTGGIALISGIVALLAHGVAKTVAAWIFGISLTAFSLPLLQIFVINPLKDRAAVARYEKEYKAERTPLIVAVEKRDIEQIKKLIKRGADVNEGKGYRTPLITACEHGQSYNEAEYEEIARILLDAGAEPDLLREEPWSYEYSTIGFKRIHAMPVAISKDRAGIVRLLIEHGADIDSYEESDEVGENGEKVLIGKPFLPFQYAIRECSYESAKVILDAGAKIGTYMYGYESGYEKNEKKTLVMELLGGYESEANIETKAYILEKLLEKIDANKKDDKGKTALHFAAAHHEWDELKTRLAVLLVEAGADVNAQDDEDKTPLMIAVAEIIGWEDTLRAAEFFTQHGADISRKDKDGKTALDLFTARYADRKLDGKEKANYDKIVELLTVKKTAEKTLSVTPISRAAPQQEQKTHIALCDISDDLTGDFMRTKKIAAESEIAEEVQNSPHVLLNDISDDW